MRKSKRGIKNAGKLFNELVSIMDRLRGPDGCPWDRRQSHGSLLKYLFEESGEVRQAVRKKDWKNLAEELGDVLLQVVFHSSIAAEEGNFSIRDVLKSINSKLIRRHPHVFGKIKVKDHKEVIKLWGKIKRREKLLKKQ
jgi:tetrapyrrole methylase family protein / MazG family protein